MLYLILFVYVIEWALYAFIPDQWTFLLGSKTLLCALLASGFMSVSTGAILYRSILALITITAWSDFVNFLAWNLTGEEVNLSILTAIIFFCWLLFIIKRVYPERIDLINMSNINILILKPRTTFDVIKGLFGFPAASICIATANSIWAFRTKSNSFEEIAYCNKWHNSHLVIDTGIQCQYGMVSELRSLIGSKRAPSFKCVWIIRHVLNALGEKYKIKSWLDYIPGIYVIRIVR